MILNRRVILLEYFLSLLFNFLFQILLLLQFRCSFIAHDFGETGTMAWSELQFLIVRNLVLGWLLLMNVQVLIFLGQTSCSTHVIDQFNRGIAPDQIALLRKLGSILSAWNIFELNSGCLFPYIQVYIQYRSKLFEEFTHVWYVKFILRYILDENRVAARVHSCDWGTHRRMSGLLLRYCVWALRRHS